MIRLTLCVLGLCLLLPCLGNTAFGATPELNVRDFGAKGDGITNDGPAFQKALDALGAAGGGTLFVPEGQYSIVTPVTKNFAGLATSITIRGVESLTPVTPPNATGNDLVSELGLVTEVYPRTGVGVDAFHISGLKNFLVKDIAFVGTENVITDAENTLYLKDIEKATIKHNMFIALASINGGSIVTAERCDLEFTQSKVLGSTANSGGYAPIVQNIEWYGITVTNSVFLDYTDRQIYGKMGEAAPISWINIGNAAAVTNHSPRREVVIREIFLDEGGWWGISSLPFRYGPPSAPIDMIYITGLHMNVSNFGQYGHLLYDAQKVFVENSHYGWSHMAAAAIQLEDVDSAIFDQLTTEASATHFGADELTGELTVINSTYEQLDSLAQKTNVINTAPEDDPVQYVRGRFDTVLGREVDPAAHYYWSDLLVHCFDDEACVTSTKAALNSYLAKQPSATFAITGRLADKDNVPVAGATVTLTGAQSVTATTDANGNYDFTNLPTSGQYTLTPARTGFVFETPSKTVVTPAADQVVNFNAIHTNIVSGTIRNGATPVAGVVVTLSGSTTGTTVTDNWGTYSFTLLSGGNYVVTPAKLHYTFNPVSKSVDKLSADTQLDFSAILERFSISGKVVNSKGEPFAGVTMALSGTFATTAVTAADGSYSFKGLEGGSNGVVTAVSQHLLTPVNNTFNDLSANITADFRAVLLPTLLTETGSDSAVALELTSFIADPFPITSTLLSRGRDRTRVMFFAKDLGLLPGEGIEVVTAEAEDQAGVKHLLRVEYLHQLPDLPQVNQIVIRLANDLENAGDVWVTIRVHGLTSNKARIVVGHIIPDDVP